MVKRATTNAATPDGPREVAVFYRRGVWAVTEARWKDCFDEDGATRTVTHVRTGLKSAPVVTEEQARRLVDAFHRAGLHKIGSTARLAKVPGNPFGARTLARLAVVYRAWKKREGLS